MKWYEILEKAIIWILFFEGIFCLLGAMTKSIQKIINYQPWGTVEFQLFSIGLMSCILSLIFAQSILIKRLEKRLNESK